MWCPFFAPDFESCWWFQDCRVPIKRGTPESAKGKGKERCGNRFVKEKELIEAILQELEWPTMDQDRFEKEVSKVLVYPDHIEVEKN